MTYRLKRPSNVLKFNPITNELEKATINLVTRNGDYIDTIPYENLNVSFVGNGIDEVSFDIRKELGGIVNTLWDKLTGLKIIEYVGYGIFEANFQTNDGDEVIKTATCKSIEIELSQQIIRELHVNDDEDIAKLDYKATYICDKNDEKHSLLHRVIKDKAPQWSIGHVDDLLCVNKKVYPTNAYQRTFTVDGISIYDFLTKDVCEECNCIITFDTINRTINLCNIKDYIYNLYTMEIVDGAYECDSIYYGLNGNVLSNDEYGYCQGIGKDTMIYISKNQLANSFSINEDTDSLKNCFYISGGDDTITGFIPAATMTGNNYIYIFDKMQKIDMPASLSSALDGYEELYNDSKVLYTGIGGVYVYDQTCTYDENTKTCRDSNNKILLDAIYNNNKVYVLDTCAYYNNGVAYTRDDNEIANGDYYYSSDGGIYTKYCHTLDRINYLNNARFPNISLVDTTAENVANSISNYFQVVENKVYLKVSWTDINFSNVTSTVETMIGVKCDSRYEIKVNKSETSPTCTSISNEGVWAGNITVKSKTNELDNYSKDITVNVMLIDDDIASELDLFNKQKLSIAVSKQDISELDLSSYTTSEQLISYFKQYNKNSLDSYCKGFNSCISTLDDLYSSVSDLSEIYAQLKSKYKLYYDSCKYVLDDISNKIELLNSQSDSIYNEIKDFQQTMSIKYYLDNIDDSLYPVFRSFIREGEYSNSNYISEGLSDSECLKKAIELVNIAEYNLKNACVVQKTVSGDLFSIFSQNDFKNVRDDFALFNYVRCRIDDKIYKLRLLSVSFSDNDTTKIDVNFSEDVVDINGITDDTKDILSKVSGISTTYSSTVQQAKQGLTAMHEFNKIHSEGLLSSDYVIANSDSEEVVQDRNGILIRSMSDIGCYGLNQMRITGNGIYLTDSAWQELPRMAIGLTKINGIWQYGVIADSIVGKLLLGEKAVIGNSSGTVTIDGDGIELDGGAITWKAGSTIPSSVVSGLDGTVSSIQDSLEQLDGRIQTYSQETQPTWTDANANHNGDLWIKPSTGTTKVYKSSSNSWEVSTDSTLSSLASSKAQIFTSTPTVPYYKGDLWVQGSTGDIKNCTTTRTSGSFTASEWVLSSKYTDDTKATSAYNLANSAKSVADTAKQDASDIVSRIGMTQIGDKYVISPVIAGGELLIGDENGTHAKITSDGTLNAKGVNISGAITATSGSFGSWKIATDASDAGLYGSKMFSDGYVRKVWMAIPKKETDWVYSIQKANQKGESYTDLSSVFAVTADGNISTNGNITSDGDIMAKKIFSQNPHGGGGYFEHVLCNGNGHTIMLGWDQNSKVAVWVDESFVGHISMQEEKNRYVLYDYGDTRSINGFRVVDNTHMEASTSLGAMSITWWASDERLKTNIKQTDKASVLNDIEKINFIQFDWKKEHKKNNHVCLGVSANQLETIGMSDCVIRVEQPSNSEYDFIRNIDTSKMTTYALKAIQELYDIVKEQKKQIEKLQKGKIK